MGCYHHEVIPVDPAINAMTETLTGTWDVTDIQVHQGPENQVLYYPDQVDCNAEQQFDILKTMVISSDLRVTNNYVCAPSKITYFKIQKESCCGFTITESDANGNFLRIYTIEGYDPANIIQPSNGHTFFLKSKVFDSNLFDLTKPGSVLTISF